MSTQTKDLRQVPLSSLTTQQLSGRISVANDYYQQLCKDKEDTGAMIDSLVMELNRRKADVSVGKQDNLEGGE